MAYKKLSFWGMMAKLTIIKLKKSEHGEIQNFAEVRNKMLDQATADWVLFVDEDESVTSELKAEISQAIKSTKYAGYRLRRLDQFLGRTLRYGENGKQTFLRLARREAGKFVGQVHERWMIKGRVGVLKNPLIHHPHESLSSFVSKIDKYSTMSANEKYHQGKRSSLLKIATYSPAKFLYNYIWLQGFRDGIPGTIMAFMMSFHSYLTWTKLYLLWSKK